MARIGNAPKIGEPLLQRLRARRAYRRARLIVCNSQGMAEAFARVYPGTHDRVVSLANPTDFAELERLAGQPLDRWPGGPPGAAADDRGGSPGSASVAQPSGAADATVLLAAGRLTRQKRPDLMVEALALLRRHPGLAGTRLWLCGEGPLAGALERQARRLGVADAMTLLGFVANPFALMRRADLFLLASDFEGLPNALIEARAWASRR